jgi:hypothetical protein
MFLSVYRINNVIEKEISWDVLGYYLYLPATFIHHDPMFTDISWVQKVNEEKHLADTLYMISSNDEGKPMYFFLMGTAILYLPFFFLGHLSASILGFPMDGFSMPYQYSMVIGGIIYTLIGLIFLRKILLNYFSEKLTALLLLLIVFGTNYIHHLTLKNLETVNLLFMLSSIVIWFTIKWHENQKRKYLLLIGISITLMGLTKPTEVLILLLPLLWNVTSFQGLKDKIQLLFVHKKALFITVATCFLIALPQISYWYTMTGHIIYDTYKNPGVGLDFLSPHIFETLFSYRKGWLLYTPIMVFSLLGFIFLKKNNPMQFLAISIYCLFSFFIIASWSEYWYGAAFSIRPLITIYPLLAICFGYFMLEISQKTRLTQILFGSIITFCIFLNQFQWWQLKHSILDTYRTTKEYYWATFLQTSVTQKDRDLLLINRDFSGINVFNDKVKYKKSKTEFISLPKDENFIKDTRSKFYRLAEKQEFLPLFQKEYREITEKDHIWIRASLKVRNINPTEILPCLTLTMERKEGVYGYFAPEIKLVSNNSNWQNFTVEFLTPEIRSTKDFVNCYIWKRSKSSFEVKDVKLEVFEKK